MVELINSKEDLETYKAMVDAWEKQDEAFKNAIESYDALWHKLYYPAPRHRGYPVWRDTEIASEGKVCIAIDVDCCGSHAYSSWRDVPMEIYLNPSKENLDKLLELWQKEDDENYVKQQEQKRIQKEKDEAEWKEKRRKQYEELKKEFENVQN